MNYFVKNLYLLTFKIKSKLSIQVSYYNYQVNLFIDIPRCIYKSCFGFKKNLKGF